MEFNNKLITEFIKELKAINNNLKEVKEEIKKSQTEFTEQIKQTYSSQNKNFTEILSYLRDYQQVVDYQLDNGPKALMEMQDIKRKLIMIGSLFAAKEVGVESGMARGMVQVISGATNPIVSKDYLQAITETQIIGVISPNRPYYQVGRRTGVSTTVEQDLNDGFDNELTTLQTLSVVSSSAQDAPSGTGIYSVIISGIGSTGLRIVETVTLNGTTPVTTANQFQFVDYFNNSGANTYGGGAVGNIRLTNTGGGTTYAQIAAGRWTWRSGRFYTDSANRGYVHQLEVGAFKAAVRFDMLAGVLSDNGATLVVRASAVANDSGNAVEFPAPIILPKSSKVLVKGIGQTQGADANCQFVLHTQPQ